MTDDAKEGTSGEPSEAEAISRPPPARGQAKGRLLRNVVRIVLGLSVGLGIAEAAFWSRDKGAFPHLNVYVADAERGVRLRPGSTERISFSKNPVSHVRINGEGYRGDAWPAPSADEVIVVGDSQVFGLGVEEDETFSAVLQASLGGKTLVRNLGVPTYGPREYNAVVEESLTKRPAKTVVWVVNLANDLFEATRANKDRHAVWDGWAVRKETAPSSVSQFPGRSLLYKDSHAFFALRTYFYERGPKNDDEGFPSEGTWRDIGDAATTAEKERAAAEAEASRVARLRDSQLKYAKDSADAVARVVDDKVISESYKELGDEYSETNNINTPGFVPKEALYRAARLSPGDIVTARNGEESRDIKVNAEHIRRGAALRVALEKKVREQAQAKKDAAILGLFEKRDTLAKKAEQLGTGGPPAIVPLSPLAPVIREVKAICDRHGARLVVVALPVDVQVSKTEWAKYGVTEAVDMEPTRILLEDVVIAARAVDAEGFDATPALAGAEPGAFLDGDLHMTPKGHRAVGEALAKVLRTPKLAIPRADLPPSRSWPPQPAEWAPNTEIAVRESDPAGCETKKVREWLGIFCRHKGGAKGVTVTRGVEVMAGALPGEALLVAPLVPGQDLLATFAFEGGNRDFTVKVGEDVDAAEIGFSKPVAATPLPAEAGPSERSSAFCTCWKSERGSACSSATAVPDDDCERSFHGDCKKLIACASGDPAFTPDCAPGQGVLGAAHRCRALCSKDVPCAKGTCVPWQGGNVCR